MKLSTLSHLEVLTQNVLGVIIALVILRCFGLSMAESLQLQAVFFITSYIRSFLVGKMFRNIEEKL